MPRAQQADQRAGRREAHARVLLAREKAREGGDHAGGGEARQRPRGAGADRRVGVPQERRDRRRGARIAEQREKAERPQPQTIGVGVETGDQQGHRVGAPRDEIGLGAFGDFGIGRGESRDERVRRRRRPRHIVPARFPQHCTLLQKPLRLRRRGSDRPPGAAPGRLRRRSTTPNDEALAAGSALPRDQRAAHFGSGLRGGSRRAARQMTNGAPRRAPRRGLFLAR